MFSRHIITRVLVCLSLALTGGGVFAQVVASDSAFPRFLSRVTGVGQQTISFGSNGVPIASQGLPNVSTAGGPVLVDRQIPLSNNSGGVITANARVSVPPSVLARVLRVGIASVPLLAVGVELYDLAQELGYTPTRQSDGSIAVTFVSGSSEFRSNSSSPWVSSAFAGCLQRSPSYRDGRIKTQTATTADLECLSIATQDYPNGIWVYQGGFQKRVNNTSQSSSLDALESAIAAKSGWPANSAVSQAFADAIIYEPPQFQATPQVTGPSTSPGNTTTRVNPDGSTTPITETYNHTYSGPTINTATTTVTSTCTGGSCNTTTETTQPELKPETAPPCGIPGTPACAVKVDETGTPSDGASRFDGPGAGIDAEKAQLDGLFGQIDDFDLGDWTWTFQLPTGCTPLEMFLGVEVNPCQWIDTIHGIMSIVWILTGIAGLFVIFSRAF